MVLTSLKDDSIGGDTNGDGGTTNPAPGDWNGINMREAGILNLDRALVRYGHVTGESTSPLSVTNSRIEHTSDYALELSSSKEIVVTGNTIAHTAGIGILVTQTGHAADISRSTTTVTNNNVSDVTDYYGGAGIIVNAAPGGFAPSPPYSNSPAPTVTGNTVTGVTGSYGNDGRSWLPGIAMQVNANNLLPSKLTGNTGTDNTTNTLELSGTLRGNWTLPATGLPISIGPGPNRGFTVPSGVTLTLNSGTILKFRSATRFDSDSPALTVAGTLNANGTSAQPVVLTSLKDDSIGGDTNGDGGTTNPAPGDWNGINVGAGGQVLAEGVDLRYASTAFTMDAGSYASSVSGRIVFSPHGIVAGDSTVDARNVDWGTPSGPAPYGTGPSVSGGGVLVLPWAGFVAPPEPTPPSYDAPIVTTDCPQVAVIGLRGSGESPQGSSLEQYGDRSYVSGTELFGTDSSLIAAKAKQRILELRPNADVQFFGIPYAALPVPGVGGSDVTTEQYINSIYEGSMMLWDTMHSLTEQCGSSTKFMLVGYSQGALAIHIEIADPNTYASQILGVALLADPGKVSNPAETVWETDYTAAAAGVADKAGVFARLLTGDDEPVLATLASRTISMCHRGDPICAATIPSAVSTGVNMALYNFSQHTNYTSAEDISMALWVGTRVGNALPQ